MYNCIYMPCAVVLKCLGRHVQQSKRPSLIVFWLALIGSRLHAASLELLIQKVYSCGAFKRAQINKSDNTQPRVDRLIGRARNLQGIRDAGPVLVWTLRHDRFDSLGPLLTEDHLGVCPIGMGADLLHGVRRLN